MTLRLVTACVLLSTTVATAEDDGDELAIRSVCAEIDVTRDGQTDAERIATHAQLVRSLEQAEQLVVERGCGDRYALSHETADNGDFIVRLAGPGGVRKLRNPDRAKLPAAYDRLVTATISAQDDIRRAAAIEAKRLATAAVTAAVTEVGFAPTPDGAASTPSFDAEPPDLDRAPITEERLLYARLLVGTFGTGASLGWRAPVTPATSIDIAGTAIGGGTTDSVSLGVRVLRYLQPERSSTMYIGGGVALGAQTIDYAEGSGGQLELSAGYAMNRASTGWRMFVQGDISLPLFSVESMSLGTDYSPMLMVSLGVGR